MSWRGEWRHEHDRVAAFARQRQPSGPPSRGLYCDTQADDATTVLREHDEGEEDSEAGGGDGEDIDAHEVLDVIGQKSAPGLRGRVAVSHHVLGNGGLRDVDANSQ